jgi:hypothetical protein
MSFKRSPFLAFQGCPFAIVALALLVLVSGASATLSASSPINQTPVDGGRKVDVMKSPRMPTDTTVEIVDIRNLQSEHWLRDLEIEVRNNSNKPIYFLEVILYFPDIPKITDAEGIERGFATSLIYGRRELAKLKQQTNLEDVPIQPGGKCILRIPEPKWKGIESHLAKNNISQSTIKRIRLRVYTLNFGDGTGFKIGAPYSVKQSPISNSLPPYHLTTLETRNPFATNKSLFSSMNYSQSPNLYKRVSVSTVTKK